VTGSGLRGEVRPPGDKSISHRALILAALARGTSRITGLNPGRDVLATRRILGEIGVRAVVDGDGVVVTGEGGDFCAPPGELDCENSGTTMRLLAGVLAGWGGRATLVGDGSLSSRPMERVAEPLRRMGAQVTTQEGHAPITLGGGELRGIDYETPVASAQIKSAILLAALRAQGTTRVEEPGRSRDHTERMLAEMGADIAVTPRSITLVPGSDLRAFTLAVPGDPSAAAFYMCAALLLPGSRIRIQGVAVNPTRTGYLAVLERMGASVHRVNERSEMGEPVADLEVTSSPLRGVVIEPEEVPSLIDEIPVLAVAAACASGVTRISGAAELRHKESDRLHAMATGLTLLGADVREEPDGLVVGGGGFSRGGTVDARGDHRVAMSFLVAELLVPRAVEVRGVGSAGVSDPDFVDTLAGLRTT